MADLLLNIKIKSTKDGNGLDALKGELDGLGKSTRKLGDSSKDFLPPSLKPSRAARTRDGLLDVAGGMRRIGDSAERGLSEAVSKATEYETSLANISTLTDDAEFATANLRDITREASLEFGGSKSDQAAALYDIISSGASTAAEATETLTAANTLAIAGLSDAETATKVLSATTANFANDNLTATDAADTLFTIVKKGRTTVAQTASAFPKIASAAGGMNLKIEEAAGIFSTLTLTAKSSAEASTQGAALLRATQKPTQQATKALKLLNKERSNFNRENNLSRGDEGFLEQIRIDSGALKELGAEDFVRQFQGLNETKLAQLFGSSQARAGLLGLIQNIDKLGEGIEAQAGRAGAAAAAQAKIQNTRAQQLKLLEARVGDLKTSVGEAVIPIADGLLPAMETIVDVGGEILHNNPGVAKATGVLGLTAVGLGKTAGGVIQLHRASEALATVAPGASKVLGTLSGKLGQAGLVGAAGAAGFAIGTLIDDLTGFSDWVASFNNDPFFDQLNEREAATTQTQIVDRKKSDIARLDKLIDEGGVFDTLSGRTTERIRERTRLRSELSRLTRGGTLTTEEQFRNESRFRPGGSLDVNIKVDSEGRAIVTGVDSNHEGEVNVRNGEGASI